MSSCTHDAMVAGPERALTRGWYLGLCCLKTLVVLLATNARIGSVGEKCDGMVRKWAK